MSSPTGQQTLAQFQGHVYPGTVEFFQKLSTRMERSFPPEFGPELESGYLLRLQSSSLEAHLSYLSTMNEDRKFSLRFQSIPDISEQSGSARCCTSLSP